MAIQKADGVDAYNNFPSKFIEVYCRVPNGASLSVGNVVVLDTTADRSVDQVADPYGFVVTKAAASNNLPLALGVACTAVPLNSTGAAIYVLVQVQYAGYNDAVVSDAAISRGAFIGTDNTTAGSVQAFTGNRSDVADYFGICVKEFTAALTDGAIIILDKGYFNG
jgi:hypothetical protein